MSIICTRCGGTQVVCEATVNPNTKVITEISDDSLQFGRCETCKARSVLTDVEKTKAAIKSGFAGFVEANGRKPHYASCRIVWKYTNDSEDVKIRLLESGESIGNDMFFSCNSLHALESLAEFGKEPFIVTECYGLCVVYGYSRIRQTGYVLCRHSSCHVRPSGTLAEGSRRLAALFLLFPDSYPATNPNGRLL